MVAWYDATVDTQAMTIRLPEDLYEQLRRAAFETRTPMNTLIAEGVELRLAALKAAAPLVTYLRHALDVSLQLDRTAAQKKRIVGVQNRLTSWQAFRACENGRPTASELREAIGDAADRSIEAALSRWETEKEGEGWS